MTDLNKHKFFLVQILKEIYSDIELANCLGFKGGTALMFFYDLPRFSVDLDFNLIKEEKEKIVYEKVRKILIKYGKIHDEAPKYFGPLVVLDYGPGDRKLKVEISNRQFGDRYEIKNLLGINMKVMVAPDMFAHKLCALLDRSSIANRDIFDCWFFLKNHVPVNKTIVESIQKCIGSIELVNDRILLHGVGELLNEEMKKFVRKDLKAEITGLLKFYKEFPIFSGESQIVQESG
jgi:predicted nucleotidyltransferase component of viral defense system